MRVTAAKPFQFRLGRTLRGSPTVRSPSAHPVRRPAAAPLLVRRRPAALARACLRAVDGMGAFGRCRALGPSRPGRRHTSVRAGRRPLRPRAAPRGRSRRRSRRAGALGVLRRRRVLRGPFRARPSCERALRPVARQLPPARHFGGEPRLTGRGADAARDGRRRTRWAARRSAARGQALRLRRSADAVRCRSAPARRSAPAWSRPRAEAIAPSSATRAASLPDSRAAGLGSRAVARSLAGMARRDAAAHGSRRREDDRPATLAAKGAASRRGTDGELTTRIGWRRSRPRLPGVLFTPATASNLRPAPRRVGHHGLRLAGELLPGDARGRHTRDGEQFGVSAAVALERGPGVRGRPQRAAKVARDRR